MGKLNMDYYEVEQEGSLITISVGFVFVDEPNELYVAIVECESSGGIRNWSLFYSGMDCNYTFKAEEKQEILVYLNNEEALGAGRSLSYL